MAEYGLVCDSCREDLAPEESYVSWIARDRAETGFALTHAAHVPSSATDRVEFRALASPNGYLRFVSERLAHPIEDVEPLRAILWALAPFVMRHDSAFEMDSMRAASFGQRLGVKPGTQPSGLAAAAQETHEGGK